MRDEPKELLQKRAEKDRCVYGELKMFDNQSSELVVGRRGGLMGSTLVSGSSGLSFEH